LERICKEMVMAYSKVLSWHFDAGTEEKHKETSVRIAVSKPIQVPTPFFTFFDIIVGSFDFPSGYCRLFGFYTLLHRIMDIFCF
jgi:hypothetical protein